MIKYKKNTEIQIAFFILIKFLIILILQLYYY